MKVFTLKARYVSLFGVQGSFLETSELSKKRKRGRMKRSSKLRERFKGSKKQRIIEYSPLLNWLLKVKQQGPTNLTLVDD